LERQLEAAGHALDQAAIALGEMQPNGRDYYPQGPKAIYAAAAEHMERRRKVADVRDEIRAIWEGLQQC
jgi:hypothetical protein